MQEYFKKREELARDTYERAIVALKMEIESQFGNVLQFVKAFPADHFGYQNLIRIFSPNDAQEISLGLFLRVCTRLGTIPAGIASEEQYRISLSLRLYLSIDNNAIVFAATYFASRS